MLRHSYIRCGGAYPPHRCSPVRFGFREEYNGPWIKVGFLDHGGELIGHLVYNRNDCQMDAQCLRHKTDSRSPKCHIHRTVKKNPLGYLSAWLISGCDDCMVDRATHFAFRLDRSEDGQLSYASRCAAREHAQQQPWLAELFELELEFGTGIAPRKL